MMKWDTLIENSYIRAAASIIINGGNFIFCRAVKNRCLQNRYKGHSMIESVSLELPFWLSCLTITSFYFKPQIDIWLHVSIQHILRLYISNDLRDINCLKLTGDKSLSPLVQVAYCWDVFWIQLLFTLSPSQTSWTEYLFSILKSWSVIDISTLSSYSIGESSKFSFCM